MRKLILFLISVWDRIKDYAFANAVYKRLKNNKLILAFFIFLVFANFAHAQNVVDNWDFDSLNSSIKNLYLTANRGATLGAVNCNSGTCGTYNGNNSYHAISGAPFTWTNNATIRCVVTLYSAPAAQSDYFMYSKDTGGLEGYGYGIGLGVWNSGGTLYPMSNSYARGTQWGTAVLNLSQKTVITWVMKRGLGDGWGKAWQVYVNGIAVSGHGYDVRDSETPYSGADPTNNLWFGSTYTGTTLPARSWNGTLDDCKIWDQDLGAAGILSDYNNITYVAPTPASLTLNTNIVNTGNYTSNPFIVSYNGTATNTPDNNFNCTLNNNITGTIIQGGIVNITRNNFFNISAYQIQKTGYFNLSCLNNNASNSLVRTFFLNTTIPFPIINSLTQYPSNATLLTIATDGVNATANVTGAVANTIMLQLQLNGSEQFINGTRINPNKTIAYNSSAGTIYKWLMDENDLLGFTSPINIEYLDDAIHYSASLTSPNQWVKMEFFNVSNSKPQNFVEIMDANLTGTLATAEYYYCNTSYISGNPTNNNNCVLFYSVANNQAPSHRHANKWDRVLPLGINTTNGKIGGVYVTPHSYILKRGTTAGELYYYVNVSTRPTTTATTTNNGALWTSQAYTVDSHIHMASSTDNFAWRIMANNSINNQTISLWNIDTIETPILPPIPITYFSPVFGEIFVNNGSLLINHSQSFSSTGAQIVNYTYFYAVMDTNSFTLIGSNNYPTTSYSWNLFLIPPNYYYIRTYVYDSLNQSSYTDSGVFYVQDRVTSGSSASFNTTGLENSINALNGGISMIGYVLLFIANLVIFVLIYIGKIPNILAFLNSIFSLVLMLVFWPIAPILTYLAMGVLLGNIFQFFKNSDSEPGKVY